MTCILGIKDPDFGKVYLGGDSAGVAGYSVTVRADEKVFHNGEFLFGFTTSFRMGQLLRYAFCPPARAEGLGDDMKYLVAEFVPALVRCLKDGGFNRTTAGEDSGGTFLLGYRGGLYQVDSDYQVAVPADGVAAVGCGADLALGAAYALDYWPPEERILHSLGVSARLNGGVRGPFTVLGV